MTEFGQAMAAEAAARQAQSDLSDSDRAAAAFRPDDALEAALKAAESDPEAKAELERAYRGSWDLAWYSDARAAAIAAGRFDPTTGKLKETQP